MKTFHEWLEEKHPEILEARRRSGFGRDALFAGALALGGLAGNFGYQHYLNKQDQAAQAPAAIQQADTPADAPRQSGRVLTPRVGQTPMPQYHDDDDDDFRKSVLRHRQAAQRRLAGQ